MFRVYRSLTEIPSDCPPSALSIGNFDGVHAGHLELFKRNRLRAAERNLRSSVLTFDPHPLKVVAPDRAPRLLTTVDERIELMKAAGIEQVFVMPFDQTFSELSPESFVRQIVVDALCARIVLVGDNFRFGHRHAGSVQTLRELGRELGFECEIVPGVGIRGHMVSSSAIRDLIAAGDVARAGRLLLRPYALVGNVVSGHGIGSKQTVPTLNLHTTAEILPANGVYVTRTTDLDEAERVWPSITNVGTRPTFNGDALTVETFLLAPLMGRNPERIRVQFLRRVREERRFESSEALKTQILRDSSRAATYHRRLQSSGIATC